MMAAKPSEDSTGMKGQIELLREYALGNFRDLLVAIAKDPAMLVWLDGRLERPRAAAGELRPRADGAVHVRRGALSPRPTSTRRRASSPAGTCASPARGARRSRYAFIYNASSTTPTPRTSVSRSIANGGTHDSRAAAAAGMQDGLDLINALATHPETARRLARRLWTWFVSETDAARRSVRREVGADLLRDDTNGCEPVVRAVLHVAAVPRPDELLPALCLAGGVRGAVAEGSRPRRLLGRPALTPLVNMGQQLFEPPDVNGWELGAGWFSTGGMLARMNFASQLATNQRFACATRARSHAGTPRSAGVVRARAPVAAGPDARRRTRR